MSGGGIGNKKKNGRSLPSARSSRYVLSFLSILAVDEPLHLLILWKLSRSLHRCALGREKYTNMLWEYCRLRGWEEETSRAHSENWRPLVKWLDGRCLVKAGILIWLKYQDARCQLELSVRQEPLFGSNP